MKIFRYIGRKHHGFTGDRMREFQPPGVKGLACVVRIIRAIQKITGQRMADMIHVNSNLVRPAGFQMDGEK